jgi:hypothetical protein
MDITPRRRSAISTILALVLAVESVSAVAAAGITYRAADRAPSAPDTRPAVALQAPSVASVALPGTVRDPQRVVVPGETTGTNATIAPVPARASALPPAAAAEAPVRTPTVKHQFTAVKPDAAGSGSKASPRSFRGRNHVWIPSLGINRSVSFFPCDRSRPPDNYVYRWGCAGSNNVYLMGHAHSVFRPLHNAYVSGRLHKGMKVWYADRSGKVRAYTVRWWKITAPTTAASWAWASQRVPSMTLQTCVGKNSQYRLMVRLVQVGY